MTPSHPSPPSPAQPTPQHHVPHDRTLIDYARLLYKRRRIVVPVFLATFVISAVNAVRQTPIYQASAQLLIETESPRVATLDRMFDAEGAADDFLQTQFRLLQSRSLTRRTLDSLQLWDAPRLGNGPEPRPSIDPIRYARMGTSALIGFAKKTVGQPDPPPAPPRVASAVTEIDERERQTESRAQSSRIDQFLGGLSILPVRNSRIVELHYTSTDPVFAAQAVNGIAKAYIQQNAELQFNTSKEATDWLSDRLKEQRAALETSEAALQAYREEHGAVPAVDSVSSIAVQRLVELNAALTKAKTDRIAKEALYRQLQAAEAKGALDTFPQAVSSDSVQKTRADLADLERQQDQLSQRYGDRHPEMVRVKSMISATQAKLQVELGKVVESVRGEYVMATGAEQSLQSALDTQRNEALAFNRQGIELGVLQRDVESNKQIYESLLQRTKESGISSELRATNVRIVDAAEVPRGPISPNIQRDLTFSFGACLLLAVALAFVLEQIDNRIRTPQELKAYLGVPFLGMVPTAPSKGLLNPLADANLPAAFVEAFKTIRSNVLFSWTAPGMRSLVVTSSGPNEGKSIVTTNLAVALAAAGQRVLLIDADMRRPRIHEIFGLAQEPGLSNLLTANAPPSKAIRWTSQQGLWLMSAGHIPPNPSELLGSKRFDDFLKALERQFDYVVIDTPPVLAVADGIVAGNKASGVVFVVRSDKTSRQSARIAVEQIDAAGVRVIGAVLNHVNVGRHPYYYSSHYRKEYSKYYHNHAS